MKRAIIILFLCISIAANATTYYVSPTGNDNNNGTSTSTPWATLNHAWSQIIGGDIVYMRGGTYTYGMLGYTIFSNKDGSSSANLNIFNYPGETPVINFVDASAGGQSIIKIENADYVHLKGIECKNYKQPTNGSSTNRGIFISYGVHNSIIENCNVHHIGGWGIVVCGGANTSGEAISNLLILNCDSHHNSDRYSTGDPWGGSDGFICNSYYSTGVPWTYAATGITFRGCRSWWNSDDGWDNRLCNAELFYDSCWSFWNGYRPGETDTDPDDHTQGGNGYGYKLGSKYTSSTTAVLRTVANCLMFENRITGLQLDGCSDGSVNGEGFDFSANIYNNTAYGNESLGFTISQGYGSGTITLKNNLSWKSNTDHDFVGKADNSGRHGGIIDDHNASHSTYWYNRTFVSSASDFAGLTSTGVDGARQADGSLPSLTFLHLASGSALIQAGTDVGYGTDIGAFKNLNGSPAPVQAPVFGSASVENNTPSILDLTYSLSLTATAPAASSFAVLVNSVARIVNSVAISGTTVHLTLSSPILNGDVLTISYTKPALNPLQTSSGGLAATISAQPVTNKVVLVSSPVYVSSSIENTTPSMLTMNYNLSLANIIPATSSFGVLVNAVARTVSSVVISGSKVQLNLSSAVKYGDIVSVTYTKPATSPIQNTSGGTAISLSTQSVTNNLVNPTKDGTPVTITMIISPNHVHRVLNVALSYSASIATQAATITPEIITVANLSGKVFLEKVLTTGVTSVRIPLNLRSGYYNVTVTGTGLIMATQKIVVY